MPGLGHATSESVGPDFLSPRRVLAHGPRQSSEGAGGRRYAVFRRQFPAGRRPDTGGPIGLWGIGSTTSRCVAGGLGRYRRLTQYSLL